MACESYRHDMDCLLQARRLSECMLGDHDKARTAETARDPPVAHLLLTVRSMLWPVEACGRVAVTT
jgi:hypothetical protein